MEMISDAEAQAKLDVLMDAAARGKPQFICRAQGAGQERFVLLRADTLGQMLAGNPVVHLSRERSGTYIARADGFPVVETGRTPDEAKVNFAEGLLDFCRVVCADAACRQAAPKIRAVWGTVVGILCLGDAGAVCKVIRFEEEQD